MIGELDHEDRLAYRLLGRFADAAEAVREARRKIARSGEPGWLSTAVARVSLTMLRVRPRGGFEMLDPAVTLRAEGIWLRGQEMVGPKAALLRAPCMEPATVGGEAGLVSMDGDRPAALVAFTVREQKIAAIHAITDREHVRRLFSPE